MTGRCVRRGVVLVLVLVGLMDLRPSTPAHAAALVQPGTIRSLALPAPLFGPSARVRGKMVSDGRADTLSGLHATPFQDVGRISGYAETATWTSLNARRRMQVVALRYLASVFSNPEGAADAFSAARIALWTIGHPIHLPGISDPTFQVREADGHTNLIVLYKVGVVEDEIALRYPAGTGAVTLRNSGWYLRITDTAAHKHAAHITQVLHPHPWPPGAAPPIAVAPWGTGPVVESPSLLLLGSGSLPVGAHIDPALPLGGTPPLGAHARSFPTLLPTGALSTFARSASFNGGSLVDITALYGTTVQASDAFHNLQRANHHIWMRPVPLDLSALPGAQNGAEWQGAGERIAVLQTQNVVIVLASTRQPSTEMNGLATQALLGIPTYLHAQGTRVVDAYGQPVRIAGLNWYGAEENDFVVGGLDYRTYASLLQQVRDLGYNTIRLPFSNQLVEGNPVVTDHISANTDLSGLHALDILDRVINYAGALGLHVILDDHRSEAGWGPEANGLWYAGQYSPASFQADWVTMARRYAVNNVVIGADLRNEPHGAATWGTGVSGTDWRQAAQTAGNGILAVNPHLLIIVEGIQYYGSAPSYWWGGNLMGVAAAPVVLQFPDGTSARGQLVYSAHDYGPDNCSSGCPWFNPTTTDTTLRAVWEQYWGYITDDATQSYAAPVWIGEFGTCDYQYTCGNDSIPGSQGQWFGSLLHYIGDKELGWTYWSLNGAQSTGGQRTYGELDWYGLLNNGWGTPFPWLERLLQSIQGPSTASRVPDAVPPSP